MLEHKQAIRDELARSIPVPIQDLMFGAPQVTGFLNWWFENLQLVAGALEIAYRRGYQAGESEQRDRLKAVVDTNHDWACGCGHWNGSNLATCGMCGRTPQESLPDYHTRKAAQAAKEKP